MSEQRNQSATVSPFLIIAILAAICGIANFWMDIQVAQIRYRVSHLEKEVARLQGAAGLAPIQEKP